MFEDAQDTGRQAEVPLVHEHRATLQKVAVCFEREIKCGVEERVPGTDERRERLAREREVASSRLQSLQLELDMLSMGDAELAGDARGDGLIVGRTFLVTGVSRGIGRAIAIRMAEHGAKVVVSSRKLAACEEVVKTIQDKYGKDSAIAIAANISSKDDLANLVAETERHWGKVDVLVCNAASNPYYGPQAGIADEQFRKILDNNIVANHWLINLCAPQMIQRKAGSIIIVSSIGGLRGSPVIGAYCISKAADMQLARNLAVEYGPHNVRVNCIAPGLIKTDFARALWEDEAMLKERMVTTPLRRIGDPDEIAGAAVFLASQAGSYVTGQSLVVDGGVTI